ncbi:zf-Tim10-DDP domain-containing protein [Mycena sanguinolenta]|uniref:Mitochondrial import inner membrane translocase subunit n=1 Tax=Mycena sanguinolenta TaxID=230812 RepID=A0A8H7CLF6_9AGAR|nr:zf-Tim10-DDP domain-containing protein [Mycena sanguinolenta]
MASLFGGGGNSSSGGLNQERLEMALTELVFVPKKACIFSYPSLEWIPLQISSTGWFRQSSCQNKCIARYAEGDLSKGETVCIDRCVAKYHEVYGKVGEKLKVRGEQQQR